MVKHLKKVVLVHMDRNSIGRFDSIGVGEEEMGMMKERLYLDDTEDDDQL